MLDKLREVCPGMLYNHKEIKGSPVIVPVGSLEDRPIGPAALDTLMAVAAACLASNLCGLAVTPPLSFGYSPVHKRWAGLSRESLALVMTEILTSLLKRMGASMIVVIDGHYGHKEVAWNVANALGIGYVNIWDIAVMKGFVSFEDFMRFEELVTESLGGKDHDEVIDVIRSTAEEACRLIKFRGRTARP